MVGRPRKITQEVLAKLEEAFISGHNDQEACLIAEIDEATLYRYCQKHPNFARKKELLKQNVALVARRNVVREIEKGNIEISKWYLERKTREEFSPREAIEKALREAQAEWKREDDFEKVATYIKSVAEHRLGMPEPVPPPNIQEILHRK